MLQNEQWEPKCRYKCPLAFSQAALPARSLQKAGRLSLGHVTQLTVEQSFTEPSTYCTLGTRGEGVLFNRVLYREAPPRGPTPYPFIYQQQRALFAWPYKHIQYCKSYVYHFWQKSYPFCIPSIDKWYPFHIPSLELPSLLTVNALSLFVNQSQNQNVFSSFHNNKINLPVLLGHSFCGFFKIKKSTFGFMQKTPKIHFFLIQDPHGIF